MIVFAWPMMLGVAGGVAALGVLALWRGERGRQWVSSTKLWAGLVDMAAGGKRRSIDPVWLMIFAGAVLGTLAASGPGWQVERTSPKVDVEWSVRSVGGGEPKLFVRIPQAAEDGRLSVTYYGPDDRRGFTLGGGMAAGVVIDPLTSEDGQEGGGVVRVQVCLTERPLSVPLIDRFLPVHSRERVLCEAKFRRPVGGTFGLLTQTGRGLRADPALWRVFAVNPAARPNDARADRKVLLVNDPAFDVGRVGDNVLIVATGQTRLPGVVLGGTVKGGEVEQVGGVNLPTFVRLDRVKVDQLQEATLSEEWEVLAKVDGRPWLATRKFAGTIVIWLASQPSRDWAMDSSFPIFFSDLLARTFPMGGEGVGGLGIQEWAKEEIEVAKPEERVVGLARWLGVLAMVLLLAGSGLLLRRTI